MSPRAREAEEYSGPDKRVKFRVIGGRGRQKEPRGYEWWDTEAKKLNGGKCSKCGGLLMGMYIPPSRETMNECAVVEHCRICGSERVAISGRNGVPG
jgi:uncharacterized OB-fold protein